MQEKREISHGEEFQIIYVETPPLRKGSLTPLSLDVGCAQWLPSKEHSVKGAEGYYPVETSDKHYFWSRLASVVINHVDRISSWYYVMKMTLYLCGIPSQNP